MKKAVILFNLGGPDNLDNVEEDELDWSFADLRDQSGVVSSWAYSAFGGTNVFTDVNSLYAARIRRM